MTHFVSQRRSGDALVAPEERGDALRALEESVDALRVREAFTRFAMLEESGDALRALKESVTHFVLLEVARASLRISAGASKTRKKIRAAR